MATTYQLSSDCLVAGGVEKEACTLEQNGCALVMSCGDALPRCRGFRTGNEINFRCTLADKRDAQAIADVKEQGQFQLLVLQNQVCKAQLRPVASGS